MINRDMVRMLVCDLLITSLSSDLISHNSPFLLEEETGKLIYHNVTGKIITLEQRFINNL
jgi:hypothetical protein